MTTAFVAGATGYTGREVVRVLRERGVHTVAHVRPDSPVLERWRARLEGQGALVDATPWDLDAMTTRLAALRPAVVFSLLGTTRARAARARREHRVAESYETVDYGLTMLLLEAASRSGSTPRFVYLSAVGVSDGTRNAYLAARARVERALWTRTLPYVIARPSFITGPDRDEFRLLERVGARVTDGVLGVAGILGARRVRERYHSMTGAGLAAALVRLGLDPDAAGRVYEGEDLRRM